MLPSHFTFTNTLVLLNTQDEPTFVNTNPCIRQLLGGRIHHAGVTDLILEMERFNVDVACLPVSGTCVMTAEEAVESTRHIKLNVAIPMHYGSIVSDDSDAERFKTLASREVRVLSKE
ncbi:MAG: MBL fold metallo-hydrolase [Candidatus Bathyarchaeia archaeon]|jgi:L-ascorbate metabolism protein UlaG (beta-lactamase superfamily)